MQRKIITTSDGSKTIQIEDWNEQYHSVHGAIQEAKYVYIQQGLVFYTTKLASKDASPKPINVLEVGFGTGLNALLTLLNAEAVQQTIHYVGVEAYPIASEELQQLNYNSELQIDPKYLRSLHECDWEKQQHISDRFHLTKQQKFFKDISEKETFDLIYFDAFGARVQPELWTEAMFRRMYNALKSKGVLTTYSAKGSVRRAMLEVGFEVEKLQGPPGKRHMLRAFKR